MTYLIHTAHTLTSLRGHNPSFLGGIQEGLNYLEGEGWTLDHITHHPNDPTDQWYVFHMVEDFGPTPPSLGDVERSL